MKIAREIAELIEGEQFPDMALEWIITAKLQPIKDKVQLLVDEGISRCDVASAEQAWSWNGLGNAPTLKGLAKEILSMLSEE